MTGVLPFVSGFKDRALEILVVGPVKINRPLSASILEESKSPDFAFKLKIHKCENLKQVLSPKRSPPHVDYVIFCLHSYCPTFIKQIEEDIGCLNKNFLLGRICLVLVLNGSLSSLDTASIMDLRQKYELPILNGDFNEDSCPELSRRVLRLVAFACGLYTGYPHIDYRIYYTQQRVKSGFSRSLSSFNSQGSGSSHPGG